MSKNQQNLFTFEDEPWIEDDTRDRLIASIVFPKGPEKPFDYEVPEPLRATIVAGQRVQAPFGRGDRPLVGYCVAVETRTDLQKKLKTIASIVDKKPLLTKEMLGLTKWMAEHYLCSWGATLETVLPAVVRSKQVLKELSMVTIAPHFNRILAAPDAPKISEKHKSILAFLQRHLEPISIADLAAKCECTGAPIKTLQSKGLVLFTKQFVSDDILASAKVNLNPAKPLKMYAEQQSALDAILTPMRAGKHETILLHGVTGSGKTEVYMQAIAETLQYGRQAIILVPEISLTPQTRERFMSRFGRVAVLHSHLRDAERLWHWERIVNGEVSVIVGARSAVFAPCPRLGLIILDEEHESSFKQDKQPRYHARDVAMWRAREESIPLVLGSATPALESWHLTTTGRARLCELPNRVSNRPLPMVDIVDLRIETKNRMNRGAISRQLAQAMKVTLDANGQVILLLNRRGYSTHVQCPACGHTIKCPNCDIAMTHHRTGEMLVCHYCDFEKRSPMKCEECDFSGLRYTGLGTQKLEAEVRARFPQANVLRMDTDTMKEPGSYAKAFERFGRQEVDILLGTQMIAKGLDFPNVLLVGVINADTALHLPDYRASERTFQLVTQVAGRTGRGERGGRVLVQTFDPEHVSIVAASQHDYAMFADQELPMREQFHYPPYWSLARVIMRGPRENTVQAYIELATGNLKQKFEKAAIEYRILGPAPAPFPKLRNLYRFHVQVLCPDEAMLRTVLTSTIAELTESEEVQWVVDMDPQDMM